MWDNRNSHSYWQECKVDLPLGKTVCQFLIKVSMLLPCGPAAPLLGIYPKEMKVHVLTKAWTWVFRAALFIIVKTWRQPRCPSVGEWVNWGPSRQWTIAVQLLSHVLTPCDPMNCSTPGFLVLHYLLEFVQIHVHWVGDAIQPSHPLSSPSPVILH